MGSQRKLIGVLIDGGSGRWAGKQAAGWHRQGSEKARGRRRLDGLVCNLRKLQGLNYKLIIPIDLGLK